ncbi:hypothetical protein CR513_08388, partial [Mucuna pruriens]
MFRSWLEYSPTINGAYCFHVIFLVKSQEVVLCQMIENMEKVNVEKNCEFFSHIGDNPYSPHNNAIKICLINLSTFETLFMCKVQSRVARIGYLTFQACIFRGHDEVPKSKNKGNFLEMIKLLASYNDKLTTLQESLLKELCIVLSKHGLNVYNICGQGYDGASKMRREWNVLQALFLNDNPYAYYVHCFVNILQLALVATTRERLWELVIVFAKLCSNNLMIYLIDEGCQDLLKNVILFCEKHDIDILDFSATYIACHGHSRCKKDHITI